MAVRYSQFQPAGFVFDVQLCGVASRRRVFSVEISSAYRAEPECGCFTGKHKLIVFERPCTVIASDLQPPGNRANTHDVETGHHTGTQWRPDFLCGFGHRIIKRDV